MRRAEYYRHHKAASDDVWQEIVAVLGSLGYPPQLNALADQWNDGQALDLALVARAKNEVDVQFAVLERLLDEFNSLSLEEQVARDEEDRRRRDDQAAEADRTSPGRYY